MCRSKADEVSTVRKNKAFGFTAVIGIYANIYQADGFLFAAAGGAGYAGYTDCESRSSPFSGTLSHSPGDPVADSSVLFNQIGWNAKLAGFSAVAVSNPAVCEIPACSGDVR
ncbi:hypothetical protein ES703_59831 [subsurface metagenome]